MKPFYIKLFSIISISCLGIIVYSNSFHCPFQYDDKIYIIDNSTIRNISDLRNIWNFVPCRFLTFFSFALNYHFHQLNVFGYHLVNLAVHLVSAILVWRLTLLTFSCPAMKEEKIARHANVIALFAGLVFVSHPVQTEAVTYIWQRAASMATMFYLASLCFYVKSRLLQNSVIASPKGEAIFLKRLLRRFAPRNDTLKKFYYLCSLLTAIAAMFTKENAITLPLMLVLYEFYFLDRHSEPKWRRISTMAIPFFFIALVIPLTLWLTASVNAHPMRGTAPEEPSGISPAHYLLTQFRVMATYIRLSFLPFNQNLDYDYPISNSIFELPVLISFLFLTIILFFAKYLFSKYRMVSFSIFWFFLTLLPESSFLPLQDVIFEHRLYLPLAGYSMFLASGMYYLLGKNNIKTMIKVMVLIIACYSILTYQRNKVWKDEFTLWDDAVEKSPHKARAYNNRGLVLARQGDLAGAIADYRKAIEIDPHYINAYINRGFAYSKQGHFAQSLSDYNKAIELNPKLAEAYINRGNVYGKQDNSTRALSDFNKTIEINPKYAEAYNDRGNIYFKVGNLTQAISDYTRAVELKPDCEDAYFNLGFAYYKQGNLAQAISNYTKAIEINPKDTEAYNNRAVSYYQLKEYDKAWGDVHSVEELGAAVNPQLINALKQVTGAG